MFHPSFNESAIISVRLRIATRGFPPATIRAPEKIPKNSDTITSLVMNARVMVSTGGIRPQIPKLAIIDLSLYVIWQNYSMGIVTKYSKNHQVGADIYKLLSK
jgi:hypothetical protein